MRKTASNRRKIRTLCKLYLSGIAEHAPNAWRVKRSSFKIGFFANRVIKSCGQIRANCSPIRSRCKFIEFEILYKVFGRSKTQAYFTKAKHGIKRAFSRSGKNVGRLDQVKKKVMQVADGALLGGNWNNGSNAGSRCLNFNNTLWNSNNNIGARACCDDFTILQWVKALADDYYKKWSACVTCYGEYITRFA